MNYYRSVCITALSMSISNVSLDYSQEYAAICPFTVS